MKQTAVFIRLEFLNLKFKISIIYKSNTKKYKTIEKVSVKQKEEFLMKKLVYINGLI